MQTATSTPAGRNVAADRPLITTAAEQVIASGDRARKLAASKASRDALNAPQDAPQDDAPLFEEKSEKPRRPATLAEAAPWLLRPFHRADVEVKISATNRDKTKGLASPYADMRVYFVRLDQICGVENWSHTITLSERGAVCALTIFGVTKSAVGDYPAQGDANAATSAEAQAFKRACTAFGLGRYLYNFPETWSALEQDGKRFIDPAGIVARMYATLPKAED